MLVKSHYKGSGSHLNSDHARTHALRERQIELIYHGTYACTTTVVPTITETNVEASYLSIDCELQTLGY